jgi:hypothetical protein
MLLLSNRKSNVFEEVDINILSPEFVILYEFSQIYLTICS